MAGIGQPTYVRTMMPTVDRHPSNYMSNDTVINFPPGPFRTCKTIGMAADHGGFVLKTYLTGMLRGAGYEVIDFGDRQFNTEDDYPDFIVPLARAVAAGAVDRGVAICGSGVGATITANKVTGVRACLIQDIFSARQGVEDDDLNVMCLGGHTVAQAQAWELVQIFLAARFSGVARHCRRLAKVSELETRETILNHEH